MPPLLFPEVRKGAVALSTRYVERRGAPARRRLDGAGKRAAFATYFAPLHFLALHHALAGLPGAWLAPPPARVVDLGCGTGAAGAAVATQLVRPPAVLGVDRSAFALGEARATYRAFGLAARTRRGGLPEAWPRLRRDDLVVLGWVVDECGGDEDALLERLVAALEAGARVVVAEPLASAVAPWWKSWAEALATLGVRSHEARTRRTLPAFVAKLDRATGLDHAELRVRVLAGPA